MRPNDRLIRGALLALALAGAWGVGPHVASGSSADPSLETDTQFSFKVVTPEIRLARHSEVDDSLVVEIEGVRTFSEGEDPYRSVETAPD